MRVLCGGFHTRLCSCIVLALAILASASIRGALGNAAADLTAPPPTARMCAQVAVCELEETFSGAICLAGPSPLGLLPTAAVAAGAEGTPADGVEAGAQAATTLAGTEHGIVLGGRGFLAASLARGSSRSKSSGGSGNASGAPATTGGSTALSRFGLAAAAAAPLRGRPIGGGGSSRRGGKIGRGGGSSTGDPRNALDRKVRKNRPISEVRHHSRTQSTRPRGAHEAMRGLSHHDCHPPTTVPHQLPRRTCR